jgi:hypothetical protein
VSHPIDSSSNAPQSPSILSTSTSASETEDISSRVNSPKVSFSGWLHTPKTSRSLSQHLIWLTVMISLSLHGIFLWLPIPDEKKPIPVKPEEKKVRITQLPTGTKAIATKPSIVKPTVKANLVPKLPTVRPRTVIPAIKPPPPEIQSPNPQVTPQTSASPPERLSSNANPWQDFPQYPGAKSGCYSLSSCLQTGKPLAEVGAYFEKELPGKKYSATPTVNESDRKVYQVSRDGVTQYLSLIFVEGKGTLYVLAEEPRTLADLSQAIEVPAEIYSVLQGLAAEDATRINFAQPDAFYTADTLRSSIGAAKLVPGESPDSFFDTYFRTNLVNSGFEPADTSQRYGGGSVYTVKKEDLLLYINLVPTQDGNGTVVVVWKSLPQ